MHGNYKLLIQFFTCEKDYDATELSRNDNTFVYMNLLNSEIKGPLLKCFQNKVSNDKPILFDL